MAKNRARETEAVPAQAAALNPQLPLFFKHPAPLDIQRHAKAGLAPVQDLSFAAATNSIVINAAEFAEASKHYPIVFTPGEGALPAAILGLEHQNYFVNAEGRWRQDAYVPAYVRKYPFVFMDIPERKQFVLCIDEAAGPFREDGGKDSEPLFSAGKPSELTNNALEFCKAFQTHYEITRRFCDDVKAAGLLEPTRSDIRLFNGRDIHLSGFKALSESKPRALPDAQVLKFYKKGWLALIYSAHASSSNWKRLADMAAERERGAANTTEAKNTPPAERW